MSNQLQQAGSFRGIIKSYGLYEPGKNGSQSVAVTVTMKIEEAWDEENQQWDDWREHDLEAEGDIWVVGKTGKILQDAINSLINHAGWDGDYMSVAEMRWKPTPCQFSVNMERDPSGKYDDKFKVAFLKAWDAIPGGGRKFLDANQAKALAAKYGSQMRALAGSVKQNVAPPANKPKMPVQTRTSSRLPKNTADVNAQLAAAAEEEKNEIPF